MKWSISASNIFFQCPKKWYYETVFASSRAINPQRKEAYLLKHLQSVYAWRGKLVDQVISRFMVPRLNRHEKVGLDDLLNYANISLEEQLSFAKAQLYKSNGVKTNAHNYCALFELEYDGSLNEECIQQAKEEVGSSLTNLMNSHIINEIAEESSHLVAQRTLQFQFAKVTVKCTPDLIAFFNDRPPKIFDWKVETPKHKEHWLQLGIYGVALSRVNPHKDFPAEQHKNLTDPTKIGLVEFQLLRNQELKYSLTDDDVTDIENYIFMSSTRMQQMTNGGALPELLINILPTARFPETCTRCKFRKICWKENYHDATERIHH